MLLKPIELREADFKKEVFGSKEYSTQMLTEFFEYWSEVNRAGSKMKFELEKTWHTGRRIARWSRSGFNEKFKSGVKKMEQQPVTEIDQLDADMSKYKAHPTAFKFEDFGKWYELLRSHKLIKKYSQEEVDALMKVYNGDKQKCRCACVMQTFDSFGMSGLKFSDLMKMRERL